MSRIDFIAKAITDHYIETGNGASVEELAARIGKSIGYVRKVLGAVTRWKNKRDYSERNYDFAPYGFEEGSGMRGRWEHRVYFPLLRTLRRRILDTKEDS